MGVGGGHRPKVSALPSAAPRPADIARTTATLDSGASATSGVLRASTSTGVGSCRSRPWILSVARTRRSTLMPARRAPRPSPGRRTRRSSARTGTRPAAPAAGCSGRPRAAHGRASQAAGFVLKCLRQRRPPPVQLRTVDRVHTMCNSIRGHDVPALRGRAGAGSVSGAQVGDRRRPRAHGGPRDDR